MLATICAWALATAVSAANRAVVVAVLVVTLPRSRRARARKATAMTRVTASMIRVMTRAMPRREDCRAQAEGRKAGSRQHLRLLTSGFG
jgi:hypothetical protein